MTHITCRLAAKNRDQQVEKQNIAMSMSVCLSVCLSVRSRVSEPTVSAGGMSAVGLDSRHPTGRQSDPTTDTE